MSGAGDQRRPVSSGAGTPPPPRRPGGEPSGAPAPRPGPEAAPPRRQTVVGHAEQAPPASAGTSPRVERQSAPKAATRSARAPWWLRVVAWVVAVPLGLALVGIPARKAGYLSSQKLLDVVIGRDSGRYLPLVVIVLLWAVVTAVLVQVIVEGGAWIARRRRDRRDAVSTPV